MTLPIGVQLYTLRDCLQEDFAGTLKQVAEIGYEAVEFAGLYGHSASEVKVLIDALGLNAVAAHVGLDALQADVEQQIEDAKTLGYDHIVVPWIDQSYQTTEGYKKLVSILSELVKPVTAAGLTLVYHNHDFEFHVLAEGGTGHDILQSQTDLAFEIDLYWVKKAGLDPLAYPEKLSGRVPLLHVKDIADSEDQGFSEVGQGTIDFAPILQAAPSWGTQAFVVEQDAGWIDDDPLKSITISFDGIQRFLTAG